jgi:arachidonate 15-lipoxygenase
VNYAQYPLMSYMPSVAGSIYKPAPTKSAELKSMDDCLAWYPPLDIALYTLSYEYLLSSIQYDTFGNYNDDPREPYFNDPEAHDVNLDFQANLVGIETIIRQRNKTRPVPYLFQLPSLIPNSISI